MELQNIAQEYSSLQLVSQVIYGNGSIPDVVWINPASKKLFTDSSKLFISNSCWSMNRCLNEPRFIIF